MIASLREGANHGCKHRTGKYTHVEVETHGEAAYEHEPCSISSRLFTGCGNHISEKLRITVGIVETGMRFNQQDIKR